MKAFSSLLWILASGAVSVLPAMPVDYVINSTRTGGTNGVGTLVSLPAAAEVAGLFESVTAYNQPA